MPVVGVRKSAEMGKSYINDPLRAYTEAFSSTVNNILNESGVNMFAEPDMVMLRESANDTMRNFFVEGSADRNSMTAAEYEDHIEMMNEMYLNDREAVLEYANVGNYNPVIGMSFPMHKNLMMNNVFDKVLPRMVSVSPKFTLSMETRLLVTPDGKEIDLWKNQMDITSAIQSSAPYKEVELTLPEYGQTDVLTEIGASTLDNLAIDTVISAIQIQVTKNDGSGDVTEDVWVKTNIKFTPGYGQDNTRTLNQAVDLSAYKLDADTLFGNMAKNKFTISSNRGIIKKVKLKARKDNSNGLLQTCSVRWSSNTIMEEIPDAIPINTPISPEEVKDIAALYNINQLTKIMSMIKDVLGNYKDDTIRLKLGESYDLLPDDQKIKGEFDFKPREGYTLDHVEWRHKTFFDALDSYVTDLLQVLNDPNMTISIVGRPDLIRKITPTDYSYQSPANIGPVDLEFSKTVMTSDKRVYQFISSQKLKTSNDLIILLNPRNTDRIIYKVVDYQMYVSNEIRNAQLHTLPSIHAFERFMFLQYQPVQGKIEILNPKGL